MPSPVSCNFASKILHLSMLQQCPTYSLFPFRFTDARKSLFIRRLGLTAALMVSSESFCAKSMRFPALIVMAGTPLIVASCPVGPWMPWAPAGQVSPCIPCFPCGPVSPCFPSGIPNRMLNESPTAVLTAVASLEVPAGERVDLSVLSLFARASAVPALASAN